MRYFILAFLFSGINISTGCSQGNGALVLGAKAFQEKAASVENAIILDVRTSREYADGHIEGAKNVDFREPNFKGEIAKLDKEEPYFVYCRSGARSAAAVKYMKKQGYKTVYDLEGGILSWQDNKLPVVK